LFDSIGTEDANGYVLTDSHAIHYKLDDNRRVYEAEGLKSFKISALISYVYTAKNYVNKLKNICKLLGVNKVEFISESLAESKYLVSKEERDLKRIIVDVGYLTTNVLVTYGTGLLYQKAFSYGGGYITADLIKIVEVDRPIEVALKFEIAERLKRKINLGYDIKTEGYYQLTVNDEDFLLPLQKSNVTVRFGLDQLAGLIDAVMRECPLDVTVNAPIALTGGGIAYMRGAKEYISSRLEMPIQILTPQIPFMNKPDESALLSLLNEALERNEK
jgi:cell division protein FtsA